MFENSFELTEQTIPFIEEFGSHIPGGFFIYRSGGNEELIYANHRVFEIFGCENREEFAALTGWSFRGIVHPDDYEKATEAIWDQISRGDTDYLEYRIIAKDGSVRWVDDWGHYTETSAYGGIFYVFISDITEKREEMEKDVAVRNAVMDTLTNIYNTVWLINDVETESCSLYHGDTGEASIHAEAIRNALGNLRYTDAKTQYVDTMVGAADRERMQKEISLPWMMEQLEEHEEISVTFLRHFMQEERYYRIDIGKVAMPRGKTGIMMGFRDVDEEVRSEERLREEEKQRAQQDSMIIALSSDYRSVYYVDLDRDEAVCYLDDRRFPEAPSQGETFAYLRDFTEFGTNHVAESFREGYFSFIQPENIRKELLTHPVITYRFLEVLDGSEKYTMLRIAGVRQIEDRTDHRVHAIGMGFADIDEETRSSMAQQQALSDALAAAEEASRAKTAFLSNMSHEIRTPMNAIIGLDSLALRNPELDTQTAEYLEKIGDSARHLLGLINDILDMSRIESGRMVLRSEEFSFRTMLEQINTMVMSQCSEKGLDYECSVIGGVSDCYIGDDTKLKQVLINILSNAIKFTDAPGEVRLTVERTAAFADQSTLRFRVKDTGIGMDKDFIPKIFDSFTQEDSSRNSRYGSTGLGMAITKSIVTLMNGTISVESQKGVGTEFTVVVTLKNGEQRLCENSWIQPKDMKVLVVDDEEIAAEHARIVLDEAGIRADTCLSGYDALDMISVAHTKHEPYNLVLLDWKMTEMDGVELSRRIRERYGRETTVIILTSFSWDDIMDEALHAGVDSFLAKPLFASNVLDEFERIARKNNMSLTGKKNRASLEGRRILLAEDIVINAEIMKQIIEMKGAVIDYAENGRVALEMFEGSPEGYYDAVLMDVRMPEMDGLEAASAIRGLQREDAGRVPIIALTANAFDEDVQRSLQVGMNAHLSKPVEPETLYETLEELIWENETKGKTED